ncbi:RGS domain-containing protein [Dipodascopsis uninucleata]
MAKEKDELDTKRRHRLPTLFEVLNRRTLTPVDLFTFYIFMRDQEKAVDYVDFWLDVAQHLSLCRHYVKQLRRSLLVETPDNEPNHPSSKRSSLILDNLKRRDRTIGEEESPEKESRRLSMILRSDTSPVSLSDRRAENSMNMMGSLDRSGEEGPDGVLSMIKSTEVTRAHIRESAYRIMATYFMSGSERELALPLHIIRGVTTAIEIDGRDDPEVFEEARDYVFQAMEREAFPVFLSAKALGNIVPLSAFLRLCVGLFGLFAAFWTAFVLIFLDYQPKSTRAWLILPFAIGVYGCLAHQYSIDPLLVLFGYSEIEFFKFSPIKEPYVKYLLRRRALFVLVLGIFIVLCLCLLFGLVPGKRI